MSEIKALKNQGRVVRKTINFNPGLNVNLHIKFSLLANFGVIRNYYSSKLEGKLYKHNTSPKSYKTKIKILAYHGLA